MVPSPYTPLSDSLFSFSFFWSLSFSLLSVSVAFFCTSSTLLCDTLSCLCYSCLFQSLLCGRNFNHSHQWYCFIVIMHRTALIDCLFSWTSGDGFPAVLWQFWSQPPYSGTLIMSVECSIITDTAHGTEIGYYKCYAYHYTSVHQSWACTPHCSHTCSSQCNWYKYGDTGVCSVHTHWHLWIQV